MSLGTLVNKIVRVFTVGMSYSPARIVLIVVIALAAILTIFGAFLSAASGL